MEGHNVPKLAHTFEEVSFRSILFLFHFTLVLIVFASWISFVILVEVETFLHFLLTIVISRFLHWSLAFDSTTLALCLSFLPSSYSSPFFQSWLKLMCILGCHSFLTPLWASFISICGFYIICRRFFSFFDFFSICVLPLHAKKIWADIIASLFHLLLDLTYEIDFILYMDFFCHIWWNIIPQECQHHHNLIWHNMINVFP